MRLNALTDDHHSYEEIEHRLKFTPWSVDKILTKERANPSVCSYASERQIDGLVYELYGLTEEEVKVVEQ